MACGVQGMSWAFFFQDSIVTKLGQAIRYSLRLLKMYFVDAYVYRLRREISLAGTTTPEPNLKKPVFASLAYICVRLVNGN
jgi:hypothetical protein